MNLINLLYFHVDICSLLKNGIWNLFWKWCCIAMSSVNVCTMRGNITDGNTSFVNTDNILSNSCCILDWACSSCAFLYTLAWTNCAATGCFSHSSTDIQSYITLECLLLITVLPCFQICCFLFSMDCTLGSLFFSNRYLYLYLYLYLYIIIAEMKILPTQLSVGTLTDPTLGRLFDQPYSW